MANVGYATLQIIPSARGFQAALNRQTRAPLLTGGRQGGRTFGGGLVEGLAPMAKTAGAAFAAIGVADLTKQSIDLEASFSKTMAQMGAVADVPKAQLKDLSKLAIKMGADTQYSANEAADAMLELAKSGISAADIKAGALSGTLTLAAAGGTDLATAATIASNAMNTFALKGKDMNKIAAALAGGANASSASVESLGEGLSQVGPAATNAGLSLQETVGALSAFDAAGIKGSDAGTSLKTMLTALVPQSKQAATEMQQLGLKFTNAKGQFLPLAQVAQQLHDKLSGLSQAQRTAALNTIFGSDASRAATVLMKLGAKGVQQYTKAASDMGAAQKAAAANMSGTSGAIEQMKGAIDTAKLSFGQLIAPAVQVGAKALASLFGQLSTAIGKVGPLLAPIGQQIKSAFSSPGGSKFMSALSTTFNQLASFGKSLLPVLQNVGRNIIGALMPGFKSVANTLEGTFLPAFRQILPILKPIATFIINTLGFAVVGVIHGVFNVINGVLKAISGIFLVFKGLVTGNWSQLWQGLKDIVSGVFQGLIGAFQVWWNFGILSIFKKGALFLTRDIWKSMWSGLKSAGEAGMSAVKGLFSRGIGWVKGLVRDFVAGQLAAWRGLWSGLKGAVNAGWRALRSAFGGALAAIRTTVSHALSAIKGYFVSAFRAAKSTVSSAISGVASTLRSLPGKVASAVRGAGRWLVSAGKDVIRGFIRGITSMAGSIISAVRNTITDHLPGFVKKALGIHSPSRVFMALGRNVAEGMAIGINQGAPLVTKAVNGLTTTPDVGTYSSELSASGAPLVGSLVVQTTDGSSAHDALEEAMFQLRRIARGGRYA